MPKFSWTKSLTISRQCTLLFEFTTCTQKKSTLFVLCCSLMNGEKTLSKFRQNGGNILKMQYLFNSLHAK